MLGRVGRLHVRDALDQSYSKVSKYFSNPVSEFPLTYHCEFIEDDAKGLLPPASVIYIAQTLLHSPPHDITPERFSS